MTSQSYLPIIITGLVGQTALTACVATGVQIREDMDKGVFDRFKSLPIARIAPLAGPMLADMLRYLIASVLTFATGFVMGYRPGGGFFGVLAAIVLAVFAGWSHGLDLRLVRHHRPQRAGRAGHLADGHVPADVPLQRVRADRHHAGLAPDLRRTSTRSRTSSRRSATWSTTATSPRRSAGPSSASPSWSRSSRRWRCGPTAARCSSQTSASATARASGRRSGPLRGPYSSRSRAARPGAFSSATVAVCSGFMVRV